MKKFIFSFCVMLSTLVLISSINYFSFDYEKHNKTIQTYTNITKLPDIVNSAGYYEARFIQYDDYSTTFYPHLKPISYHRFAYE